MKKNYVIDLKVYNSVPQEELAFIMPMETLRNGNVPAGIHHVVLNTTERLLDELMEKTFEHPDLKILGIHSVKLENQTQL